MEDPNILLIIDWLGSLECLEEQWYLLNGSTDAKVRANVKQEVRD